MFYGKDGEEFIVKLLDTTKDISRKPIIRDNYIIYIINLIEIGKYIWNDYKDKYDNSDRGCHGEEHLREVMLLSFKLCIEYRDALEVELHAALLMCTIASITHDSYSYTDRDNHHERASMDLLKYLKNEKVIKEFSKFKIRVDDKFIDIATSMVYQHRASYVDDYSYKMCELFSAADRGEPNFDNILKRAYLHNKGKTDFKLEVNKNIGKTTYGKFYFENSINFQGELEDYEIFTILHMVDKFGKDGYIATNLKKDSIYKKYFNVEISFLYSDILELVNASNIKECLSNVLKD